MKRIILLSFFISFTGECLAQESFKKSFWINPNPISRTSGDIYLMKDTTVKYENMDQKSKEEINKLYPIGSKLTVTEELVINDKKVTVSREITIDQNFLNTTSIGKSENVTLNHCIKSSVIFEGDKVYINGYLQKDANGNYLSNGIFYYKLKNRQTIKLYFGEFNVSALTLPIKYRFKGKDGLKEDFSASINGNILFGYSIGRTSFFYQEKVGNKSNTLKLTGGLLLGASTVTLNSSNTSKAAVPVVEDVEIVKGLATIGYGVSFSYNKINLGVFSGYDYAIGEEASKWNYNKKPWLGIAVGYSLFNF